MAATGSDPSRRRGLSPLAARLSLRLRLTLLYGSCFLVGGAAVLAITYAFVARDTSSEAHTLSVPGVRISVSRNPRTVELNPSPTIVARGATHRAVTTTHTSPAGPATITSPRTRSVSGGAGRRTVPPVRRSTVSSLQKHVNVIVGDANVALTTQRRRSLQALLTWSGVALGVMAVISILLGWALAGRALRPLRTMTSRALEITEDNLHKRLSVDAREDELGILATTFDGVLGRLERAFAAQKRFVANASHELRTPVTLERTLLEVALADPDADATELRHTCERVLASTEHQERMIEALLTLARSQGDTDIDTPVNLADLVQDAIAVRERRLEDIIVAADLHPATLNGDPALLERLVANLIDNAIIHNLPQDAWITVETGNEQASSWLRVSNSGSHVPESMLAEIFEPFCRIDGERGVTGLGLGLSIVQAIADVHNASIDARPADGGGLRVEVRF